MVESQKSDRTNGEQLSPEEVRSITRKIFSDYAWKSNEILHPMVEKGEGRSSLGSVSGRPNDEQLVVDAMGEDILANLIKDARLPAFVFGEHNTNDYSDGNPQVVFTIDPFDNSGEFARGLDTPPYSVLGAYNPDGSPIGSVVVDIKGQKAFVSIRKENRVIDLSTIAMPHQELKIVRPKRTSVRDKGGIVIASYVGEREYSRKYYSAFGLMEDDWSGKSRHYGNGGAFVYAFLASGAIDAYVMFDEPHSEILPGLPLALAAGCVASSVILESGKIEEYRFDPDFIINSERYTHGTVPLFISARTPELRDEIIEYYLKSKKN